MSASENATPKDDGKPDGNSNAAKPKRTPRKQTFRERWKRMSLPNQLMFSATLVIAAATVINVIVFVAESNSASGQTDKLVGYSKVQANAASDQGDAAQQFSDTSEDISDRLSDAVDQLKAATDANKATLDATIKQFRSEQRPWVGIQGFDCSECSTRGTDGDEWTAEMRRTFNKPEYLTIGELFVIISNSGRTPATQMTIQTVSMRRSQSEPIPDWDLVYRESQQRTRELVDNFPAAKNALRDISPVIVLPPNAPQKLVLLRGVEYKRNFFDSEKQKGTVYILGKIAYSDINHTVHTTKFCLLNSAWATRNDFTFCQSGNSMD